MHAGRGIRPGCNLAGALTRRNRDIASNPVARYTTRAIVDGIAAIHA